jgi:beta-lactamase superfamily II metal-dependent hydrolase
MSTRHTVLKRRFHWLVISVLTVLSCGWVDAQDMTFFALRRPGQGSVAVDHKTFTAYITDLGNAGDGDLATLDGKPLLDRLAELQMKRLVFTCSHPHSDHMGGSERCLKSHRDFL